MTGAAVAGGHRAEGGLIDMLQLPSLIEGLENLVHRLVAHEIPQLVKEQLTPGIDRDVVGGKVPIGLAR